jgi:hypothetical protein
MIAVIVAHGNAVAACRSGGHRARTPSARRCPQRPRSRGGDSLGSDIVLDDEGHAVTNTHVVDGARRFDVTAEPGTARRVRGFFPRGRPRHHRRPGRGSETGHVRRLFRRGGRGAGGRDRQSLRASLERDERNVRSTSRTVSEWERCGAPVRDRDQRADQSRQQRRRGGRRDGRCDRHTHVVCPD